VNRVGRFRFVSSGISKPLHGRGINAHRRFAYNFKIPRHAGKTVVPLTEHDHLAFRVGVDDPWRLRDLCWPGRHRTGYFDLRRTGADTSTALSVFVS